MRTHLVPALAAFLLSPLAALNAAGEPKSADIVIYGGTTGGVFSAIAAARAGASVIVLEPGAHVGGMVTGGLGFTDTGLKPTIGGMAADFYRRVHDHYEKPEAWKHQTREEFLARLQKGQRPSAGKWWVVEPNVAAAVLGEMMAEAKVKVLTGHRLESVVKNGARLISLRCENGSTFDGRVFIDASYEGDLMAKAGVSYAVGRESAAQYGEPLAGVVPREYSTRGQIDVEIDPYDAQGGLLYGVQKVERGQDGEGDRKVQTYNFRLCLTDAPENRVTITKPPGYDPARYELMARYFAAKPGLRLRDVLGMTGIPNRKTDLNNRGNAGVSTDFIGMNWDYPDGDYATRRRITQEHIDYTQGLLYFLGHDARVPQPVRGEMLQCGYAADEFAATGHFPPQMYIREARRMVGACVMTAHDITTHQTKPDSIGLASYKPDSHAIQRIVDGGFVRNEGNPNAFTHGARAYEVPYRALTPKLAECDNLLVTFCVSASHMAFSSLRMEPVFMILSQSAATAAVEAVRKDLPVQNVDVAALQKSLKQQGQILAFKASAARKP